MTAPPLSVLGIGLELPPSVPVREFAASKGADVSFYKGWDRVSLVRDDEDQPSTMGSLAFGRALAQSGVEASEIRMLIFTGVSRDYPASWSVATEVMRLHGMADDCVGLDLTIGCLATLSALDLIQSWLATRGGGYAAIVAAERWSHTVDHSNSALAGMWAWADGAAAMIVGMGTDRASVADFLGAEFTSNSDYNGQVLIPYGGTRAPSAPPGVDPSTRTVGASRTREEIKAAYARGYTRAYDALTQRLGLRGERLICNQMSPPTLEMIAGEFGIPMSRVLVTANDVGHLGTSDLMFGLHVLAERNLIDGPIALGASTAYAFGAGLVVPPST